MKLPWGREVRIGTGIYRESVKKMTTYACVKVGIEKLKRIYFIHRAHSEFLPLVADAHSAELPGRHPHACKGRECAITSELGRRGRGGRVQKQHLRRIGGGCMMGSPSPLFVLR